MVSCDLLPSLASQNPKVGGSHVSTHHDPVDWLENLQVLTPYIGKIDGFLEIFHDLIQLIGFFGTIYRNTPYIYWENRWFPVKIFP